jgi:hypothetical protein
MGFPLIDNTINDGGGYDFPSPPGFAEALQANVTGYYAQSARRKIVKRIAPASTIAVDVATNLPGLTGAAQDSTNSLRPSVTWTAEASLSSTDGGAVTIRWYNSGEEMQRSWTFIVPPTATTVTAPQMPSQLESWLPVDDAGSVSFQPPEVLFGESTGIPSYREFRAAEGVVVPSSNALDDNTLLLPADGTLRLTEYFEQIAF